MTSPIPTHSARPDEFSGPLALAEAAPVLETTAEPAVRGERLLRRLERGFLRLDRVLSRALPEALNPFLHTGAITVTALFVALATGVLLLFWYRPSVHLAYDSVVAMSNAPWTSGLVRSLHRYSSDACMFFALVHALRLFSERRFAGARWLAWVTGIVMLAFLWFIGWTGYWLVWDEPGQRVAEGTAQLLDALPIFADPLARSFLTDEGVNTFLFFVIFFFHMLVPLGIGVALWLHLARLSRARFLTRRPLLVWALASMVLVSVVLPPDPAGPARMAALTQAFEMDWWYLAPLIATDRLGGGALWAILFLGGAALLAVPWSLGRGPARAASVVVSRCNACEKCYNDCPYDAISMIPRTDGSPRYAVQSSVDPAKCVGCGICAGSCDTAGVGLEWISVRDQRKRLAGWLMRALTEGEAPHIAFVCAESAAGSLAVDLETGRCPELPGYLVVSVPCAGWVHPFAIEHSLRFGAKGALVSTCASGQCRYREGAQWERMRLDGEREPVLRTQKVARDRLLLLSLDATRTARLVRAARAFRESGVAPPERRAQRPAKRLLAASVLGAVVAGLLGAVSQLGYATPSADGSQLVVSFKHPGQLEENCRERSEEELARLPVHMRQTQVCDRARAAVRLRVRVDGVPRVTQSYPPKGIWGDLNSVAIEPLPIEPGEHRVEVAIGDSSDADEWTYTSERTLSFNESERRVVLFDRVAGFSWH